MRAIALAGLVAVTACAAPPESLSVAQSPVAPPTTPLASPIAGGTVPAASTGSSSVYAQSQATATKKLDAARSEDRHPLVVTIEGDSFPVVNGTTDLPNGTTLFVVIGKPWLPDGAERLAHGLPACADDCISAEGPDHLIGATVEVKNSHFAAGPFSFRGQPFAPGAYPVEVLLSVGSHPTDEELCAMGTNLFRATVQIPSHGQSYRGTPGGPPVRSQFQIDSRRRFGCKE